jgi:hypothetical protein
MKAFFKIAGTVVGSIGGFAALFIVFGYITLQSFLSNMNLYGLAYFPLQFYKEASVTFLRDISKFYTGEPILILPAIIIIALPLLLRSVIKSTLLKKAFSVLCLIFVSLVVFFTFTLGIFKDAHLEKVVFNAISLPVLSVLFIYLAVDFQKFESTTPFKNLYAPFLIIFILLFLSIPIGYGSCLYDITVFTVSVPKCNSENTDFKMSQKYKLLYLMGHTSEREIFFDVTTSPINIILVDKKLINSIKVNYSKVQIQTLRNLYNIPNRDLFDESIIEQKKIIPGEVTKLDKGQLDEWLKKK